MNQLFKFLLLVIAIATSTSACKEDFNVDSTIAPADVNTNQEFDAESSDFDTYAGNPHRQSSSSSSHLSWSTLMQPIQLQQQQQYHQPIRSQHQILQQPIALNPQRWSLGVGSSSLSSPLVHQQKSSSSLGSLRYSQPIVTYAQPIVQQVDMTAPKIQKQHINAEAIVQPVSRVILHRHRSMNI